jgi:hypothetical protein
MRCEDNIKMAHRGRSCEDGKSIDVARDHAQWQALALVTTNLRKAVGWLVRQFIAVSVN